MSLFAPQETVAAAVGSGGGGGDDGRAIEERTRVKRCQFWLANKRRHCANSPLPSSQFCGNHSPSTESRRVPCPIDPSHTVLKENLDSHTKRCPLRKQALTLETKPYYSKGINGGVGDPEEEENVGSDAKRRAIFKMTVTEFWDLVKKIKSLHSGLKVELPESYAEPDACKKWLDKQLDRQIPYQEKHVMQQVSILGNMEAFGILKSQESEDAVCEEREKSDDFCGEKCVAQAAVEFGAGRGYLTQMLADCYGIQKVFLVERRSYKLKADRSLRQKENMTLERLRIDIEDLDLNAIESLRRHQYLAIGKHLCGSATDLALQCCLPKQRSINNEILPSISYLQGLAIATCCHHLCQWRHYINTKFMSKMGITKEDFDAITWFSSWAVDADHSSADLSNVVNDGTNLDTREANETTLEGKGVEDTIRSMRVAERAVLGFMCKEIIDFGRLFWLRDNGLDARLVKYVPINISPENHLLVAKCKIQT